MKKKVFEMPFIGVEIFKKDNTNEEGISILYGATGNTSVIMEIQNASLQYGANPEIYENFHDMLGQIVKILGAGYIMQKTDIIANVPYSKELQGNEDYLTQKYFKHFENRIGKKCRTYLTITYQAKKDFFNYDAKVLAEFVEKINKIISVLNQMKCFKNVLDEKQIEILFARYRAFNFKDESFSIGNIYCNDKAVYIDNQTIKSISLIDIDEINLPTEIGTYHINSELGKTFPTDNLSFLLNTPAAEVILYNQVIVIPDQLKLRQKLELKKKRHSSMPDPANKLSVEDIESMFISIAQDNELLVEAHFNILVAGEEETMQKAVNSIEGNLFQLSITPGKNTYNQMELWRSAIPGNAGELKEYDLFTTSRPSAVCFFFKERILESENSHYLLHYTDRQGIPIGIDTSELPRSTGRINNRNRFILGPSGSGKSFLTNTYTKQCKELGADIVIVDTGNSYSGLCNYFGGRYITYTEKRPITMNPFNIEIEEFNLEKVQILVSLIGMIWLGVDASLTTIQDDILTKCIHNYFSDYFYKKEKIKTLSFNSFYEFSLTEIEKIIEEERIKSFNIDEYKFILKKFYKGGMYDTILNDNVDSTLFKEEFIVFEIDNIKEHKLLFPITTLIIMDVFLQKMRHKDNKKILIIEEAWKAIASPMMAGYILYLYKTVRKWGGEAIVVTQDLSDIIGNPIVKDSIISNSDTIFLLDQTKFKDKFDEIAEVLSLNEVERNKIFTINNIDNKDNRSPFKEVYIKRGSFGEVYGIEVPLEEYMTYTTERSEKQALQSYLNKYKSYQEGVDAFINDFKNSGLSLSLFIRNVNNN